MIRGLAWFVWNRGDYLLEAERQLSDARVYRDVSNTENILSKLSETRMFSGLKKRGFFNKKTNEIFYLRA